jgi:hypothetical protein
MTITMSLTTTISARKLRNTRNTLCVYAPKPPPPSPGLFTGVLDELTEFYESEVSELSTACSTLSNTCAELYVLLDHYHDIAVQYEKEEIAKRKERTRQTDIIMGLTYAMMFMSVPLVVLLLT